MLPSLPVERSRAGHSLALHLAPPLRRRPRRAVLPRDDGRHRALAERLHGLRRPGRRWRLTLCDCSRPPAGAHAALRPPTVAWSTRSTASTSTTSSTGSCASRWLGVEVLKYPHRPHRVPGDHSRAPARSPRGDGHQCRRLRPLFFASMFDLVGKGAVIRSTRRRGRACPSTRASPTSSGSSSSERPPRCPPRRGPLDRAGDARLPPHAGARRARNRALPALRDHGQLSPRRGHQAQRPPGLRALRSRPWPGARWRPWWSSSRGIAASRSIARASASTSTSNPSGFLRRIG